MSLSFEDMGAFIARAEAGLVALEVEATAILEATGHEVADVARALAPVSPPIPEATPGELAASISIEVGVNQVDIIVGAPYAVHVEYGTSKMAAEPFFQPALAQAKL